MSRLLKANGRKAQTWKKQTKSSIGTTFPTFFCDGALAITFRHNVCRIALHSDRIDPSDSKTINRVVIGHLAMSPSCFVDFYNMMSQAIEAMRKAGIVHRSEPTTPLAKTQ